MGSYIYNPPEPAARNLLATPWAVSGATPSEQINLHAPTAVEISVSIPPGETELAWHGTHYLVKAVHGYVAEADVGTKADYPAMWVKPEYVDDRGHLEFVPQAGPVWGGLDSEYDGWALTFGLAVADSWGLSYTLRGATTQVYTYRHTISGNNPFNTLGGSIMVRHAAPASFPDWISVKPFWG